MKYRILMFIYLAAFPLFISAQTDTGQKTRDTLKEFSFVQIGLAYSSDALFMGRKDSLRAPYLMPSIGYYAKSGFFVDASLSYLSSEDEQRIDLFLLSAGYLLEKGKLSYGIMGVKYFYNEESYNVLTEVEGAIAGLVGYDLNIIETSLQLSSYFNTNGTPDFFAGVTAERSFYSDNQNFLINPSVTANAGTLNFYEAYYSTSRLGNRKSKGVKNPNAIDSENIQIEEAGNFNLLSIEVSLPVYFSLNNFIFHLEPIYVLPLNAATIDTGDNSFVEELDNTFYWNISIAYQIERSRN
jgi:hypothetical protein